MQQTQTAVSDACAKSRTEHGEAGNVRFKRIPIVGAKPALRAARPVRLRLRTHAAVEDDKRVHEACPKLFQYGANTCADSA